MLLSRRDLLEGSAALALLGLEARPLRLSWETTKAMRVITSPSRRTRWRREILPRLGAVPHVEEEKPVVCAWYPSLRSVRLWNLAETRERLTIRFRDARRMVEVEGLDTELVSLQERGSDRLRRVNYLSTER